MKYTDEQLIFIKDNCNMPRKELADLFNDTFKESRSKSAIHGTCKRNGWLMDKEYWNFNKGNAPFNKGLKGYMKPNRTSFKKGSVPHNYRPVGSERITKDGYVEVKIKDPRTWRLKHLVNWENVNGKVPKGHCVVFIDGNRQNCELPNLQLITRAENAVFNKSGYSHYPVELRPTLRTITKLDTVTKNLIHKIT